MKYHAKYCNDGTGLLIGEDGSEYLITQFNPYAHFFSISIPVSGTSNGKTKNGVLMGNVNLTGKPVSAFSLHINDYQTVNIYGKSINNIIGDAIDFIDTILLDTPVLHY